MQPLKHVGFAFALAIAATFPLTGPAYADSTAAKVKSWDPDKDGTLDLTEVKKAAEAKFESLETDKDSTLDQKEMHATKVDATTFKKADPDGDGTLTKDEYMSLVEARFKAADTDHDGTLSVSELKSKAGKSLLQLLK